MEDYNFIENCEDTKTIKSFNKDLLTEAYNARINFS